MQPDNQQPQAPEQPTAQPQYQSSEQTPNLYGRPLKSMDNPLSVMQPGERVICHITRHPFGLIGVYFIAAVLVIGIFTGAALIPHYATDLTSQQKTYVFIGAALFTLLILAYVYVARIIYNGNRWIVSSDSITQITQTGLFNKQTSQLSLGNLEDVTFEQESIIQTMFGFGTLHVETAGERSKFVFPFCPTPQQCAREIIQAHEEYMTANPEATTHDNQGLTQTGGIPHQM